jgi:hypothetical protein
VGFSLFDSVYYSDHFDMSFVWVGALLHVKLEHLFCRNQLFSRFEGHLLADMAQTFCGHSLRPQRVIRRRKFGWEAFNGFWG